MLLVEGGGDSVADGGMAQRHAQFPAHARIVDEARFGHEGKRQRRQHGGDLRPRQAGRTRQREAVGEQVVILAHAQAAVVHDIENPPATGTEERRTGQPGKIVGMDVVGKHVVFRRQHRIAALQARQRQTVGGIDARRAQDGERRAMTAGKAAQTAFGIDAAARTRTQRPQRTALVDESTAAVAIHPGGAYVHKTLC